MNEKEGEENAKPSKDWKELLTTFWERRIPHTPNHSNSSVDKIGPCLYLVSEGMIIEKIK